MFHILFKQTVESLLKKKKKNNLWDVISITAILKVEKAFLFQQKTFLFSFVCF